MKRTVAGLVCCVCILIGSACGGNSAENVVSPADVIFDSQMEAFLGGIRLDLGENQWDGFGEAVDVNGDVLAIGASEWNQCGAGSVHIYRLFEGTWQKEAQLVAKSDR